MTQNHQHRIYTGFNIKNEVTFIKSLMEGHIFEVGCLNAERMNKNSRGFLIVNEQEYQFIMALPGAETFVILIKVQCIQIPPKLITDTLAMMGQYSAFFLHFASSRGHPSMDKTCIKLDSLFGKYLSFGHRRRRSWLNEVRS